jgi:hypothetical protein
VLPPQGRFFLASDLQAPPPAELAPVAAPGAAPGDAPGESPRELDAGGGAGCRQGARRLCMVMPLTAHRCRPAQQADSQMAPASAGSLQEWPEPFRVWRVHSTIVHCREPTAFTPGWVPGWRLHPLSQHSSRSLPGWEESECLWSISAEMLPAFKT